MLLLLLDTRQLLTWAMMNPRVLSIATLEPQALWIAVCYLFTSDPVCIFGPLRVSSKACKNSHRIPLRWFVVFTYTILRVVCEHRCTKVLYRDESPVRHWAGGYFHRPFWHLWLVANRWTEHFYERDPTSLCWSGCSSFSNVKTNVLSVPLSTLKRWFKS